MTVPLADADFRLSPAGTDRAGDIAKLQADFDFVWNEAGIAGILVQPAARALILDLERPGKVAGFVIGLVAADEAEIVLLGIASELRRRGLACRLVDAFGATAKAEGARRLLLDVAADNAPARALYGKLGFIEVGERPAYYARAGGGMPVAAVQLAKQL